MGDINSDGSVNKEDAALLFGVVNFPDQYTTNYKGTTDFNGDGITDTMDVILLFHYSNFIQFFQSL